MKTCKVDTNKSDCLWRIEKILNEFGFEKAGKENFVYRKELNPLDILLTNYYIPSGGCTVNFTNIDLEKKFCKNNKVNDSFYGLINILSHFRFAGINRMSPTFRGLFSKYEVKSSIRVFDDTVYVASVVTQGNGKKNKIPMIVSFEFPIYIENNCVGLGAPTLFSIGVNKDSFEGIYNKDKLNLYLEELSSIMEYRCCTRVSEDYLYIVRALKRVISLVYSLAKREFTATYDGKSIMLTIDGEDYLFDGVENVIGIEQVSDILSGGMEAIETICKGDQGGQ